MSSEKEQIKKKKSENSKAQKKFLSIQSQLICPYRLPFLVNFSVRSPPKKKAFTATGQAYGTRLCAVFFIFYFFGPTRVSNSSHESLLWNPIANSTFAHLLALFVLSGERVEQDPGTNPDSQVDGVVASRAKQPHHL